MVGGSGIHPTKNLKSIIRPISVYKKNPYPYPSIYMLMDGRTDRALWSGGSSLAGFYPPLAMYFSHFSK